MGINRNFITGLLFGAFIALSFIFTTGAVLKETSNAVSNDTASFRDLACSADGQTVYVLDVETVYRSTDGGNNWSVVLKKNAAQP